jgi:hypothetical protein
MICFLSDTILIKYEANTFQTQGLSIKNDFQTVAPVLAKTISHSFNKYFFASVSSISQNGTVSR